MPHTRRPRSIYQFSTLNLTKLFFGHLHERIHRRTILFPECFLPLEHIRRLFTFFCSFLLLPFEPIRVPLGDPK